MGDSTKKDRTGKKNKTGVGCLLLRRPRRRANSEPPKGKRHDRVASCSPRTIKPRKIPRDDHYRIARNSEADSGFLSFESDVSRRNENAHNINKPMNSQNDHDDVAIALGVLQCYDDNTLKQDFDRQSLTGGEIIDLNENFDEFGVTDRNYDSDSVSIDSNICFRCSCMPRVFRPRNSSRSSKPKRFGSFRSSQSYNLDKSSFDLRGSKIMRTISDLQSVLTESDLLDKSKCFLSLVYNEHRCIDPEYCTKAKFSTLNAHLRTLIECMPKTHCDCESKVTWTNCVLNQAGYISHRRNAICETTERTRQTVGRAFCTFMTLKALLRYDLL